MLDALDVLELLEVLDPLEVLEHEQSQQQQSTGICFPHSPGASAAFSKRMNPTTSPLHVNSTLQYLGSSSGLPDDPLPLVELLPLSLPLVELPLLIELGGGVLR